MLRSVRSLAAIVRSPVPAETRRELDDARARLPEAPRTPRQLPGPRSRLTGVTSAAAAGGPPQSAEEIRRQMHLLRPVLGADGSLRLTDGEVVLRPMGEGIELLRYAHSLGLVATLLADGDTLQRRPGLLERLMWEGGVTELAIRVDTTQRGPTGRPRRDAANEAALNPLRDEFAEVVREARRRTGLPLRATLSMAVTRDNLAGVPDVLRWLLPNADAFHAIAFEASAPAPGAGAGGPEDAPGPTVSADELWARIAEGVGTPNESSGGLRVDGRSGCHRLVHGIVARRRGGPATFHPVRQDGDPLVERVVDGFLGRFGGVTFRHDSRGEAAARLLWLAVRAPGFVAWNLGPYVLHWLRRIDRGHQLRAARELATGAVRLNRLTIESHHFAGRADPDAAAGGERPNECAFRVAAGDGVASICEVNALGIQTSHYQPSAAAPQTETTTA